MDRMGKRELSADCRRDENTLMGRMGRAANKRGWTRKTTTARSENGPRGRFRKIGGSLYRRLPKVTVTREWISLCQKGCYPMAWVMVKH
jgi:hypothetical protein